MTKKRKNSLLWAAAKAPLGLLILIAGAILCGYIGKAIGYWFFALIPLLGGVVAVFMYEPVKTQQVVQEEADHEEEVKLSETATNPNYDILVGNIYHRDDRWL